MGVEMQVKTYDQTVWRKGDVVYMHEGPPYILGEPPKVNGVYIYLNVIVTDATEAELVVLMEPLTDEIDVEDETTHWRLTKKFLSSLLTQAQKDKLKTIIKAEGGVSESQIEIDDTYVRFLKSGNSLVKLKRFLKDLAETALLPRKFRINNNTIDNALQSGMYTFAITKAQLQNNIVNKSTKI